MQEQILNHRWLLKQAEIIRPISEFPLSAINGILLTRVDKDKITVSKNKDKVLNFISERKRAYLSEITEKFNLDIVETKLILNELQKEGKIKINE